MNQRASNIRGDFNVQKLSDALLWQINIRGISQKDAAREMGINPSLITRMSQGKRPDVDTLTRVLVWLELDPRTLFDNTPKPNALADVRSIFLSDPSLTQEGAQALMNIVSVAYNVLRKENGNSPEIAG